MTETQTFCDCCGVEVGGCGDKELFVVMTVGKSRTERYCFGCAKELLEASTTHHLAQGLEVGACKE